MKTLTQDEVAKLTLKQDEAMLISVSGGILEREEMHRLVEFVGACERGETPCALIFDSRVTISVIKASEITTKMVLIQGETDA